MGRRFPGNVVISEAKIYLPAQQHCDLDSEHHFLHSAANKPNLFYSYHAPKLRLYNQLIVFFADPLFQKS